MAEPQEITLAVTADALAQRYHCLPTDILAADARNLQIAELAVFYQNNQPAPGAVKRA
jgi:hypothetical protein